MKFSVAILTALSGVLCAGTFDATLAQSGDPYIGAIDDRPAARLKRKREADAAAAARARIDTPTPSITQPPLPSANRLPPTPASAGFDMVVIEPGTYFMGSPNTQKKRDRNEGPQVPVTIDYAFEIGRTEVTFEQWGACVAGGGCNGYKPKDNGWGKGDRPVTNVSYKDAESYVQWLSAKTGLDYRLPSESEWEYVARAGQPLPFSTHAGRSISAKVANFNGEFPYGPNGAAGTYLRKTVPVASYPANRFGVHDIHGNVYEWVSDCYVAGHAGNPGDGSPRRDGDCNARIIRGGSWVTHGYQMRAAKRLRYTMEHRYDDFGFRVARTLG